MVESAFASVKTEGGFFFPSTKIKHQRKNAKDSPHYAVERYPFFANSTTLNTQTLPFLPILVGKALNSELPLWARGLVAETGGR